MRRDLLNFLKRWKDDPIRVPLMIRGARQVGKSWLATTFGQEFFIEQALKRSWEAHF